MVIVVGIIGLAAGGGTESADTSPTVPAPSEVPGALPTDKPTAQSSEEPAAEPSSKPAGRTINDGTWVVNDEIKPGIYRAPDPGGNCYWERLKDFTGGFNSIIANGNAVGGPIVVEIEKSDKGFTSDGCGPWASDLSQVSASRTSVGDGIWIVGTDMAPGTYRTTVPGGNCYWARLRGFDSGNLNNILANDLPGKGSAIVEITPSDAGFETSGCGIWKKV